jgi:hypothetical protein
VRWEAQRHTAFLGQLRGAFASQLALNAPGLHRRGKRRRRFALPFDKLRALSLSKRPAQSKIETGGSESFRQLLM